MTSVFKKTSLVTATLAVVVALGVAPKSAEASGYGDCVAASWNPIGCLLRDYAEDMLVHVEIPSQFGANKEDKHRISAMVKHGGFDKLDAAKAIKQGAFKGSFKQVCEMNKLLDLIEKGTGLRDLEKMCFKSTK